MYLEASSFVYVSRKWSCDILCALCQRYQHDLVIMLYNSQFEAPEKYIQLIFTLYYKSQFCV